MFDESTEILHGNIMIDGSFPSVTPIFQCSAFSAESPYFYSRKDNPNVKELEAVLRQLEHSKYCIAVSTGMTALYTVLDLLSPGEILVTNKDIYGCSYKLFQRICNKRRIEWHVLDLSLEKNIQQIPKKSKMILFETPTNPFLKTVNINAISTYIKKEKPDAIIVVDNTWATPLYQNPLLCGADISLYSATKYFSGHSDVMGGMLLTDNTALYEELKDTRFYGGSILTPFNAWLLRRSMQTFKIRMDVHSSTAEKMNVFLENCPQITKVYYPELNPNQLRNYGGIIFFELRDDLVENYKLFSNSLKLFDTGTGMACVTSMVAQPYTGSHASMSPEEKKDMGLSKGLVRLCFGLEKPEDLEKDLLQAFKIIDS